jgi:hypothetical protein
MRILTSQNIFLSPGLFSTKNKDEVFKDSAETVANDSANIQK